MNVYVETNFVLELVFQQEQSDSCEEILVLCEEGKAQLILPAYCLAEPHEKITRQNSKRKELQRLLEDELRQLARTTSYRERIDGISNLSTLLIQSNQEETQRLEAYRLRLLHAANIIPLSANTLMTAAQHETAYDLTPQDAIVYASVIQHLSENPATQSCFLNKNTRDFDNPDIVDSLRDHNCRMIPRFDHGLQFLRSQLDS